MILTVMSEEGVELMLTKDILLVRIVSGHVYRGEGSYRDNQRRLHRGRSKVSIGRIGVQAESIILIQV